MLASVGFLIAAVCFGAFAYSFERFVVQRAKLKLQPFAVAYYALAAAFALWAGAAATGSEAMLAAAVLVGEALILVGTLSLAYLLLPASRRVVGVGALAAMGAAALLVRAVYFYPQPYMSQGIVIFNIATPVAVVLGLMVIGVWLPASARVARQVAKTLGDPSLERIYSGIYVAAAVSALVFTAVKRPVTAALSFAALTICFALLIGSNVLVKMVKEPHGKSR
jgi:hypothetical protein